MKKKGTIVKKKGTINIKRAYDPAESSDGIRILVDRLWPRGLSKADAHIDAWLKSIAPSTELRKWYDHDPEKWPEFQKRYFAELDANPEGVQELLAHIKHGKVSFLYSSKVTDINNAVALLNYVRALAQ